MVNFTFRLLLTFNATSLLLIIFLVKEECTLRKIYENVSSLQTFPDALSYAIYVAVPLLLTWISILLSSRLGVDEFKKGEVTSIEYANNSFLPSYLGYFFVALSVNSWGTLWFVYALLFVFTFLSQALYFNPLFLLFGYEFYNVKTQGGTTVFLITKKKFRRPIEVEIKKVFRINNYTFIDRG